MTDWTAYLDNIIKSIVETKANAELLEKYPNIKFTMVESEVSEASFPTVYIRPIAVNEVGADLDGKTINAVDYALQVDVTTTQSQSVAREVIYTVQYILKGMRFQIKPSPTFTKEGNVYRSFLRANRIIGNGDKF